MGARGDIVIKVLRYKQVAGSITDGVIGIGPVWGGTRAQSGDWYSSGTLHPGQVLRGSLPLLAPIVLLKH
jgi:hypothetical protein